MNLLQRRKLNWYDDRITKRLVNAGEYSFTKYPENILDLGAHKGFATEWFAKKYPKAKIHSYEPNPKLYQILESRMCKYPNVWTFNEAIAGHDGTIGFAISERDVSSMIGGGQEVPCVSLITAVARIAGNYMTVSVKSDIEGAEFDAFKDIPPAVIEVVGEVHPEKAGRDSIELLNDLQRFGNRVVPNFKATFHAV